MKVLITGATGLIGSELVPFLQGRGHSVIRAVRKNPKGSDIIWNPEQILEPIEPLEGLDAVIHLAGENVGGRWNEKKMERILKSRVEGTRHLVKGLVTLKQPPKVFLAASAMGYYGNQGDAVQVETSAKGTGFLSDVTAAWEQEALGAATSGMRVVLARLGIVLSSKGGALGSMLTTFKLGLGGVIGSGEQYMSWISIDDVLGAFLHLLTKAEICGPVNVVAPHPVTNRVFTKELGEVLGRPTLLPMPAWLARLAFGKMADEMLLSSTCVKPERLKQTGYRFLLPELKGVLRYLLGV